MEQSDLLRFVVSALESLHLRYFVTGSTVTIFFGEPRFTNDIDVVVDLPEASIVEFCQQFPADDFYMSESAVLDAVQRRTQFNIIHPNSGLKIDVIIPTNSSFNQSRFDRARRISTGVNTEAVFASPEDAIIKKMEYFQEGKSEKHLRDIASVLKTSGSQIDYDYITRWSQPLGLAEIWAEIQRQMRR